MRIFYDLVKDVEEYFQVRAARINIAKSWAKAPPAEAEGARLTEFIGQEVATRSYVFTFWKCFEPFYKDYQVAFGHKPYIPIPNNLNTW